MRWGTTIFVTALFAWVIRSIVRDAERLEWHGLVSDPWPIVTSVVLWLVAFLFRAWLWGEMMRRTGYAVPHVAGARVFLASHLGRFLPGKMWSVLGAGIFGKQLGVRHVPTLEFIHDALPENARHLEELLAQVRDSDAAVAAGSAGKTYAGDADPYKKPRELELDDEADELDESDEDE